MRIDPELAATLAAVADEGTLDAASRALRITPSAVSQRVKTLEQQLGRILLVRTKPVRLTAAGESVVRLARQIALLEQDALAGLGVDDGVPTTRPVIPLAVNADSMATWFLPPLARLAERHGIDFDLHRDDQNFTARLLESGDVMIRIAPLDSQDIDLQVNSSVEKQFGDAIRTTILDVLSRYNVRGVQLNVDDKGALDCILRARLEALLARAGGIPALPWEDCQ